MVGMKSDFPNRGDASWTAWLLWWAAAWLTSVWGKAPCEGHRWTEAEEQSGGWRWLWRRRSVGDRVRLRTEGQLHHSLDTTTDLSGVTAWLCVCVCVDVARPGGRIEQVIYKCAHMLSRGYISPGLCLVGGLEFGHQQINEEGTHIEEGAGGGGGRGGDSNTL